MGAFHLRSEGRKLRLQRAPSFRCALQSPEWLVRVFALDDHGNDRIALAGLEKGERRKDQPGHLGDRLVLLWVLVGLVAWGGIWVPWIRGVFRTFCPTHDTTSTLDVGRQDMVALPVRDHCRWLDIH